MDQRRRRWLDPSAALLLVGATTGVGIVGRAHLKLPDMVALYLLAITISATLYGRGPSLLAATLSVLAYDFFFVPPILTFAVSDLRHMATFVVMFVVGVIISGLTLRVRRHEREARKREERTAALYALSQGLSEAEDEVATAALFARLGRETFESDVTVFGLDGTGHLVARSSTFPQGASTQSERRVLEDARERGSLAADEGPKVLGEARYVPLRVGTTLVGALTFSPSLGLRDAEDASFLDAFAQQGALALQRIRLKEQAEAAALRARTEEMKNALLSTVSHDLRTPLAAITGAATTLRDDRMPAGEPERSELLETICEEADRLDRLVRNLLDMTKVEAGALKVKREWVPLEEIVGAALTRLEKALIGRPVGIALPPQLPLLSVDAVLLEQVFVNLLENAVKYTPEKSAIEIRASVEGDRVLIAVSDRGPGLPTGVESRVFEKFFRAGSSIMPGAGLGLAICRGVVEAHGGEISAENREGGGAAFVMTLPLAPDAPSVPTDTELVAWERAR
jgi:two-component system, OmpR family, sensor histidine kinase KdpD